MEIYGILFELASHLNRETPFPEVNQFVVAFYESKMKLVTIFSAGLRITDLLETLLYAKKQMLSDIFSFQIYGKIIHEGEQDALSTAEYLTGRTMQETKRVNYCFRK